MSLIILNVDEVRRTLSASGGAFVVHDKEVDIVRFAINSGFADIVLDGQVALRVMYQRPGETEVRAQTLTYYDTDGLRSYYDWHLLSADLAEKGTLTAALCILRTDNEVEEWHTTPCQIRVLDTIHTDDSDEGDESITPTVAQRVAVLETMIQRVASGAPIVVASVSDMTDTSQIYVLSTDRNWYYHNGTAWTVGGEYGAVATDRTLTQDGVPADAKVVGDIFNRTVSQYRGTLTGDPTTADVKIGTYTSQKTADRTGFPDDMTVYHYAVIQYFYVGGLRYFILIDTNTGDMWSWRGSAYVKYALASTVESLTYKWSGKKWAAMGDSLTAENSRATKRYHDYVAEATGITVVNLGVSGTGYKKPYNSGLPFWQRVDTIPADSDVITIFGSGNDLSQTLGTVTDTGTDTICGCINTTIDDIRSTYIGANLGIITPTPWVQYPTTDTGNKMDLYADALVEICKRKGVPCLDLYHCSNMLPWEQAFREAYYTRDDGNGVHPDENGHRLFAPKIRAFLEALL